MAATGSSTTFWAPSAARKETTIMARPPAGQVVERDGKHGRRYALRFRAHGRREYVTTAATTEREAEQVLRHVLADVERGIWQPSRPTVVDAPAEDPTFHAFRVRVGRTTSPRS
jgi:hypothetical protein